MDLPPVPARPPPPVHYAAAQSFGTTSDRTDYAVIVTRCARATLADWFNGHEPDAATCPECIARMTSGDAALFRVYVCLQPRDAYEATFFAEGRAPAHVAT